MWFKEIFQSGGGVGAWPARAPARINQRRGVQPHPPCSPRSRQAAHGAGAARRAGRAGLLRLRPCPGPGSRAGAGGCCRARGRAERGFTEFQTLNLNSIPYTW